MVDGRKFGKSKINLSQHEQLPQTPRTNVSTILSAGAGSTSASSQTLAPGSSADPAAVQQTEEGATQNPAKTQGSTVSPPKATYQVSFTSPL